MPDRRPRVVQLQRQEELTRRLQEKLAEAGKRRVKTPRITPM
jgi:hypothetical protein